MKQELIRVKNRRGVTTLDMEWHGKAAQMKPIRRDERQEREERKKGGKNKDGTVSLFMFWWSSEEAGKDKA